MPYVCLKTTSMKRFTKILDLTFYSLILLYTVVWLITWHQTPTIVYIHEVNFLVLWALGYEFSKKIGLKYIIKTEIKFPSKYIYYSVLGIVSHIIIHPFYAGSHSKTTYVFKWWHLLFEPYLAKNLIILSQMITIGLLTLIVFSILKRYQKNGRKTFKKKAVKYTIISSLIIASLFLMNTYATNDLYLKFDEEPKSVQQLIGHEELKGKYIYLDFWHSGCSPCIKDLKKYEEFYANLPKNVKENVAFVFIGVDRNKPGESTKQKYYIKKLNIDAKHYFISKAKLYQWWNELNPDKKSKPQFSQYFLINPKGEVELENGPKIGDELKALLKKKTS